MKSAGKLSLLYLAVCTPSYSRPSSYHTSWI